MSALEAYTPDPVSITTGQQGPYYSVLGFGSVGIAVAGTFTSGTIKFQGSNDGNTWTDLQIMQASVPVSGDVITTTGNYVCGIVSYQLVRLFTTSFVGQIVVTASISPQIVLPVIEGGDIVVDSLTITGIDDAALATDENGLVYGVTGTSGDVMRLSGTGSGEQDSVVYTGSLYITVGASGAIYTSTDSQVWTQRTSPTTNQWFAVTWNGTTAVAVGLSGVIATSTDGVTWTSRTSGVATNIASVTWDGTNFIAVGSSQVVLTSPDGTTWTSRTFGTTIAIRGVASTSSLAVAVCASGTIKTSTDHGVTWTSSTSGVATTLWKVAVNALGTLWTAVGSSGVILTSPDGTTWTSRTSGAGTTTLENIAFGNSLWVAVGDGGFIATSPTGTTWTVRTSGTTQNLFGLTYGATWVVVGDAIKLTSSDGITWSTVSQNVWVASPPTGTGAIVTASGASTFNDLRQFTTPIRETTILSAAAIATGASGDHIAATTVGIGSSLATSVSVTATLTLSDCSAGGTVSARFTRSGNVVVVDMDDLFGTSNGVTGNVTGVPANYVPTRTQICAAVSVRDNDVDYVGSVIVRSGGTFSLIYLPVNLVSGGLTVTSLFTASGNKGLTGSSIAYVI